MLARAVPGLTVIVGANRYLSGRLAERRLRATIHILDDGFQHFELARTVDLLLVSKDDVQDRPMPAGRLREPLDAASQADALIVDADDDDVTSIGAALGVRTIFRLARRSGSPRLVASAGPVAVPPGARVFAVAGIARPDRFFSRLASNGWQLVGTMAFRDHHRFGPRDIERIAASARSAEAAFVLTTDKDAVRLAACNLEDLGSLPVAAVPLVATIEPAAGFGGWLFERLQ